MKKHQIKHKMILNLDYITLNRKVPSWIFNINSFINPEASLLQPGNRLGLIIRNTQSNPILVITSQTQEPLSFSQESKCENRSRNFWLLT